MDMAPKNPEFSRDNHDYDQLAVDLYDAADLFISSRQPLSCDTAPSPSRYMSHNLTTDELDLAEPILATNMIDPADSIDLAILGGNPYATTDSRRGILWFNIRHGNLVSSYSIWLSPYMPNPISPKKDMYRIKEAPGRGEMYESDQSKRPEEYIFSGVTIGIDEWNALREIVTTLNPNHS